MLTPGIGPATVGASGLELLLASQPPAMRAAAVRLAAYRALLFSGTRRCTWLLSALQASGFSILAPLSSTAAVAGPGSQASDDRLTLDRPRPDGRIARRGRRRASGSDRPPAMTTRVSRRPPAGGRIAALPRPQSPGRRLGRRAESAPTMRRRRSRRRRSISPCP